MNSANIAMVPIYVTDVVINLSFIYANYSYSCMIEIVYTDKIQTWYRLITI